MYCRDDIEAGNGLFKPMFCLQCCQKYSSNKYTLMLRVCEQGSHVQALLVFAHIVSLKTKLLVV